MRYLLDTNMFALAARGHEALSVKMARRRRDTVLSTIVLHELFFGAFKSDRIDYNLERIQRLGLPILPFDKQDAKQAGRIRAVLKAKGNLIGPYDLLIAGQALARDLTLVSANVGEFSRVVGLRVEDWTVDR